MKRGDFITVAVSGDYGKPRPALVIQSDLFGEHGSVTVLPVTSTLIATPLFRVEIEPTPGNGLRLRSQVMVDKAVTVPREKAGAVVGSIDKATLVGIDRSLAVFLGIA